MHAADSSNLAFICTRIKLPLDSNFALSSRISPCDPRTGSSYYKGGAKRLSAPRTLFPCCSAIKRLLRYRKGRASFPQCTLLNLLVALLSIETSYFQKKAAVTFSLVSLCVSVKGQVELVAVVSRCFANDKAGLSIFV